MTNNALEQFNVLNEPKPCKEGTMCKNSPFHSLQPKCNDCRLSPVFVGIFWQPVNHYWKPVSHKWKHAVLEKEKRDAKRKKALARQAERKAKDPARQARLRKAARAERKTNAQIISATRNSGRVNKDGDHLFSGNIIFDTKQQGTTNPIVRLHELDKVRADAKRNNCPVGGLVLRNVNGRGVIVFDENDIGIMLKALNHDSQ